MYQPVMARPDWVLERYFGWDVLEQNGGMKVLRRRRGPFTQALAMLLHAPTDVFAASIERHRLCSRTGAVVVVDFHGRLPARLRLNACELEPVEENRWFGAGTYVVDLTPDEEVLWARMDGRSRTACRQAERQRLRVRCEAAPDSRAFDDLIRLHAVLIRERGLPPLPSATFPQMAADGRLLLARAVRDDGDVVAAHLAYVGDDTGFFLYGASHRHPPPGAGNLLQWEILRRLKARGLRWYDLGQVPSRDPGDRIHRFKSSFGGVYVDYGREYRWMPGILDGLQAVVRRVRTWRHGA